MNLHQFRHILIITVLLPLVLLLLLALVLAWQIQRTLREQRRIDHTDRITAQLNELERLVVDQETGLRGYQLTRDPTTLAPYQDAEGALHQTLDRLLLLVREDPDQLRRLRQIRDSHELWIGFAGKALDNLRARKTFRGHGARSDRGPAHGGLAHPVGGYDQGRDETARPGGTVHQFAGSHPDDGLDCVLNRGGHCPGHFHLQKHEESLGCVPRIAGRSAPAGG